MKQNKEQSPKNQKAFYLLLFVQIVFFASAALPIYALITQNITLIIFLVALVLVQIPITKWQAYVDFVSKNMHPSLYFKQFDIIEDSAIPPTSKCLFAFHPHSVYAMGILASMNYPNKPYFGTMVTLSSDFALNTPIMGALFKIWGVGSASASSVKKLMREGKNIGVLPGGFQQATITSQNEFRILTKRKGFIKYSLENDYQICPTIILGEHSAFWTFEPFLKLRLLLNKIKIPGVIYWNKFTGIFLPRDLRMTVITGKGIMRKNCMTGTPSQEEIDQVHREYTEQIERLYSKYKSLNRKYPLKHY